MNEQRTFRLETRLLKHVLLDALLANTIRKPRRIEDNMVWRLLRPSLWPTRVTCDFAVAGCCRDEFLGEILTELFEGIMAIFQCTESKGVADFVLRLCRD